MEYLYLEVIHRIRFQSALTFSNPSSVNQARDSPPPQPGSDCPVEAKLAVSVLAAPTTHLSGVWLHRYCNVAVDVAVDI